jgi:hypothetical protein
MAGVSAEIWSCSAEDLELIHRAGRLIHRAGKLIHRGGRCPYQAVGRRRISGRGVELALA